MRNVMRWVAMGMMAVMAGCDGGSSVPATTSTAGGGAGAKDAKIKIGFIVKQPDEPWFKREWRFADEVAAKYGFEVIHDQGVDGEKVALAIQNLATAGAQGFIICTPQPQLGPAIVRQAKDNGMKVLAVDDQFVGEGGKPMTDVPYLGIEARKIGNVVGQTLAEQMKARGWAPADTGLAAITWEDVETTKARTDGAIETVTAGGLPADHVFKTAMTKSNQEQANVSATNLLTQHPEIKHWLVCGMNDSVVMGGVRAMEARGFKAENVVGVGIDGDQVAIDEFNRAQPTGFYASVLLSAQQHGAQTAEMMYKWIKDGTVPPMDTRTTGIVITRENFHQVLKEQGVSETQ